MARTHLDLVTPPADTPVSLDDLKRQVRQGDLTDPSSYVAEDALLELFLAASVGHFDGKRGHLFRCLMPQVWKVSIDWAFPTCDGGRIRLQLGPVRSITSVVYIDNDGAEQTLDSSAYEFVAASEGDDAFIQPAYGTFWPVARCQPRAVTVTYAAGYADAASVPAEIKVPILMLAADLYNNREASSPAAIFENPTVKQLLQPFKRMMTIHD